MTNEYETTCRVPISNRYHASKRAHEWIETLDLGSDKNKFERSSLLHILLSEWIYNKEERNCDKVCFGIG
jgi:hypothetical protein